MLGYMDLKEKLENDQLRYYQYLQTEGGHGVKREYFNNADRINIQNIAKYNK